MWKGQVDSSVAPCDRRGEGGSKLVFGVSREPVRPPRQETLFLADSSRLRAARLPCPRFSPLWFLFFSWPLWHRLLALSEGLDPGESEPSLSLPPDSSSLSLSPSRFLPRMFLLTRYSPDRERKSWELNECRVPLEGSLSMPTRETPFLAS